MDRVDNMNERLGVAVEVIADSPVVDAVCSII